MTCELFAEGDSHVHSLDPRIKVVGAVIFSIFLVFVQQVVTLLVALSGSIALAALARLDTKILFKRLSIINFFVIFVCLFLPWTLPGQAISIPFLPDPSIRGLEAALALFLKSNAMVLFNIDLLSTSSVFALNHAMAHLRFPNKLINLFFFSWRYLHVLEDEFHKMRRAALARGFEPTTSLFTYKTFANILGGLFVRSVERGERVHQAMVCRGFNGIFPLLSHFHLHKRDLVAATAFVVFLAIMAGMELL